MDLNDPMAPREEAEPALPFSGRWPLLCGAVAGVLLRLVFSGGPGDAFTAMAASFILLGPLLMGGVTVYVAERQRRRSWGYYFWTSAGASALAVVGTLAIMVEGIICAILILPLTTVLGGLAGLLMGAICRWSNWPGRAVYGLAFLPLLLGGLEPQLPLPQVIREVHLAREVHASPAQVWTQLVDTRAIRPDEVSQAWMYRIGVPLPQSGVTEERNGQQIRHITMGRNIRFDQVAEAWEEQRRVRWSYRFTKDSFPPQALDDHVMIGGHYFDLLDTEYELTPSAAGTALSITMRYRVSTQFNWYTGPIARWLIGDFARVILDFYARRAEAAAVQPLAAPSIAAPTASATSIPSTPADMMPPA